MSQCNELVESVSAVLKSSVQIQCVIALSEQINLASNVSECLDNVQ